MASAELLAVKEEIVSAEFQQQQEEEEKVTAIVTEASSVEENDSGVDNSGNSPIETTAAETTVMQETVTPVAAVEVTPVATGEGTNSVPTAMPSFHVLPANYQLLLQQQYINFLHLQQSLLQVV